MTKRKFSTHVADQAFVQMAPAIKLNRGEEQLQRLLLDTSSYINKSRSTDEPVVIRWAGGWVRDKVLGMETNDIDVAINSMTGVDFAQHMHAYCSTQEAIGAHSIKPDDVGNLHNVSRNPDKSKHLETAMLRMFGLDLDLVNLRKERYAEDSRNPIVEFGTPEEDALRRDATVNALFFNLHTNQIEDFTGGLQDLKAKVLRTPLNPLQTFKDDPLRVLRLVRFASRLNFSIDADTSSVMADEQVLAALRVKISRERVGTELEKMLKGDHPFLALKLIDDLGLYHSVFTDPTAECTVRPDLSRWHVAYSCLRDLQTTDCPGSIGRLLIPSDDSGYVAWNLAALSPWMVMASPPSGNRKSALPPASMAAREGLKAPNKLTDTITASHMHRKEIMELKRMACGKEAMTGSRHVLGMAIRKWDSHGGFWTLQVLNALLVEAMETMSIWPGAGDRARDAFIRGWQRFLDQIVGMDLYDAPFLKRLLDGRSLAKAIGAQPGRWTGKALDVCLEWQFRNPTEKDPSGAIAEVRRRWEELGIPRDEDGID
ncbi:uncharacterized protein UV8b_00431 [Ustilaginoidea virens]|uniref:tRNA nucleotidyltransferase n=1 Tax=Ustilaginoidea virens TaxID=1159556 RepID=A0A8E5HIR2_USTVR|nr:uncharacterized protein UV8b_00431 [Ustilaginoidea virens]QUC16190.1 hypothetical protein UV8b_00431 [Ustilaginoidea virens]